MKLMAFDPLRMYENDRNIVGFFKSHLPTFSGHISLVKYFIPILPNCLDFFIFPQISKLNCLMAVASIILTSLMKSANA